MIRPQDRIPADQPGRGINSAGDVIRFAVGRTDGKASMDDLDAKVRETVEGISQRYAAATPGSAAAAAADPGRGGLAAPRPWR